MTSFFKIFTIIILISKSLWASDYCNEHLNLLLNIKEYNQIRSYINDQENNLVIEDTYQVLDSFIKNAESESHSTYLKQFTHDQLLIISEIVYKLSKDDMQQILIRYAQAANKNMFSALNKEADKQFKNIPLLQEIDNEGKTYIKHLIETRKFSILHSRIRNFLSKDTSEWSLDKIKNNFVIISKRNNLVPQNSNINIKESIISDRDKFHTYLNTSMLADLAKNKSSFTIDILIDMFSSNPSRGALKDETEKTIALNVNQYDEQGRSLVYLTVHNMYNAGQEVGITDHSELLRTILLSKSNLDLQEDKQLYFDVITRRMIPDDYLNIMVDKGLGFNTYEQEGEAIKIMIDNFPYRAIQYINQKKEYFQGIVLNNDTEYYREIEETSFINLSIGKILVKEEYKTKLENSIDREIQFIASNIKRTEKKVQEQEEVLPQLESLINNYTKKKVSTKEMLEEQEQMLREHKLIILQLSKSKDHLAYLYQQKKEYEEELEKL